MLCFDGVEKKETKVSKKEKVHQWQEVPWDHLHSYNRSIGLYPTEVSQSTRALINTA
jgi:hypothetical protein